MLEMGARNKGRGDIHLGPANALNAFALHGAGTFLPIHRATFDLGLHPWDEPAETLLALAEKSRMRIPTPTLGRPFEPVEIEGGDPRWRKVKV